MQSLIRSAFLFSVLVSVAIAAPPRRLPPGGEVHPETTLALYRATVLARELRDREGKRLVEFRDLPKAVQEIAGNLTKEQIELLARYESVLKSSSNPKARQAALEELHRTFWDIVPEKRVEELGNFGGAQKITLDTINKIADGTLAKTDKTLERRLEDARTELKRTEVTRAAEADLATGRRNLLAAAEALDSPGLTRDMVSFARQDGMLGSGGGKLLAPMTAMLKEAGEAMEAPQFKGKPAAATLKRAARAMADYALFYEDAAGLESTASVFTGVLRGARTSGSTSSLEGMMRMIEKPVEAAKAELASELGAKGLKALVEKTRKELGEEGKGLKDEEVAKEISLRDLRAAVEEKLLAKYGDKPEKLEAELKKLDRKIDDKHDGALAEALAKLCIQDGKVDEAKVDILANLVAKSKRRLSCVGKRISNAMRGVAAKLKGGMTITGISTAALLALGSSLQAKAVPCSEGDSKACPALARLEEPAKASGSGPKMINLQTHKK